jgi:hypothetical protein
MDLNGSSPTGHKASIRTTPEARGAPPAKIRKKTDAIWKMNLCAIPNCDKSGEISSPLCSGLQNPCGRPVSVSANEIGARREGFRSIR